MTVTPENSPPGKSKEDFDPVAFMRSRNPDLYSDSTPISKIKLSKALFEYYLETLTNRNQETEFAYFCRRLAEKEICPNLRAQTGPTGGGDSKADSETILISSALSELWVGFDPKAANERWAFAFSAKKAWKSKVESDVSGIAGTNRSYKRIYFITNQFARDKDRAEKEDQLGAKHGIRVIILDRTWITQAVFEHDRISLAVEALGIEEVSLRSERRTGPRDLKRQHELDELEAEIGNPGRYAGARYQLAEDCLRAALLARGLEKPQAEVDGYFTRADRIATEVGHRRQRLRIAYNYAWTTIFWYGDHLLFNSMYPVVESLALQSDEAGDVELAQTLWQVLTASVWRGALSREETKLDSRRAVITAKLDQLSSDPSRPNNALQAKTGRVLLDVYVAMERRDTACFEEIWSRSENIIDEAEYLGDYPFERFVKLIRLFGELGIDSPSFDSVFEKALAALERRRSEVAGGELLVEKGFQKLSAKRIYEAVRLFGRALERFIKHESQDELVNVLMGLCIAYQDAGLLWAARNNALGAVERSLASFRKDGEFNPLVIPCLKKLAWLELQLGRLPRIIEACQLLAFLLSHQKIEGEARKALEKEWNLLDAIIGILIVDSSLDQLRAMEKLPDIFERIGLYLPKAALLYALGYREKLREEGFSEENFREEDIDHFMKRMMEQPAKSQIPAVPNLMDRKTVEFRSTILGCSVNAVVANDDQSIYLAEALLGAIEAFLATSLEQRILPFRSEAKLVVKASAAAAAPFIISEERAAGYQSLLVQHPLAEPNQVDAYHQKYRDTMMEAVARVLMHISVLDDVEEYFKSVAGEERGFARALIFSDIGVISENVFGAEPRLRLTDLLEGDETVYRLKRDKKWSEGLVFEAPAADENEDQEPSPDGAVPSGLAKFANMPHSARQVVSLIDVPLWNRAGWSATMYASDPLMRSPPILGIGFKDIAAGREIFHELRAKLGNADQNNKLRVAILTGIDRANPPSYNVVIGTNLRSSTVESGKLFMTVSRVNQMTPRDTSNLDRFLMAYRENGTYFIAPVHFDGSRAEMPEVQLGIRKTDIIVRPAWEVGPHDEDAMGIRGDDDPIIPEGQDDAPVLKTLKARQQGFGRR